MKGFSKLPESQPNKLIKLNYFNSFAISSTKGLENLLDKSSPEKTLKSTQNSNSASSQKSIKSKKKISSEKSQKKTIKCCNCKKSKCLKLYCECFSSSVYCTEACNCSGCYNRPEYEKDRKDAMLQLKSKNYFAFQKKGIVSEEQAENVFQVAFEFPNIY